MELVWLVLAASPIATELFPAAVVWCPKDTAFCCVAVVPLPIDTALAALAFP